MCETSQRCAATSSRKRSGSQTDIELSVQPASRHTVSACMEPLQWKNGPALMNSLEGVSRWHRAT